MLDRRHDQTHARQPGTIIDGTGGGENQAPLLPGHFIIPDELRHDFLFLVTTECKRCQLAVNNCIGQVFPYFADRKRGTEIDDREPELAQ